MNFYVLEGSSCKTFYAISMEEGVCQSIEVWKRGETLDCIFLMEYTVAAGTYDAIASKAIQEGYKTITQKEFNAAKKEAADFLKKIGSSV